MPGETSLRVGVDLAAVARIEESLAAFGERYVRRVFTAGEAAYAKAAEGRVRAERLAARFAAKEATIKALDLGERGVAWTDIEIVRMDNGAPRLALHGSAQAAARDAHVEAFSVSLSHEDGYAIAVVVGCIEDPKRVTP